jgi:hypothetical protein
VAVTALYVMAVAALAPPPGDVVGAFNLSLSLSVGLFALLWFLLGASFGSSAIALGRFGGEPVTINQGFVGGFLSDTRRAEDHNED